jgi:gamma-glutamylputrescine oxidase
LKGEVTTDVCVVGGGFAGTSAALNLAERGMRVVLLEADTIGAGASGRNGGQLHSGQRLEQDTLETMVGNAEARRLWELAEEAKALVRDTIARLQINCDLRDGLIAAAWKAADAAPMRAHVDFMRERYGYETRWLSRDELHAEIATQLYHGGVFDPGGGHLQPLAFVRGMASAAESSGSIIHENTKALAVDSGNGVVTVRTASGMVRASHVILACDMWLKDLDRRAGSYAVPINSFIAVTAPLGEERARSLIRSGAAVSDTKDVVDYYRLTPDHRLLFGGGETYFGHHARGRQTVAVKPMLRVFPQLADVPIDHAWGGAVGITLNRMPHFGWSQPNVCFAHGFSGHGVAIATLAGRLMAEAVTGTMDRFDVYARLKHQWLPSGAWFRVPLTALGMAWYALKDRL